MRRGFTLTELIVVLLLLLSLGALTVFGFRTVLAKSTAVKATATARTVAMAEQHRWQIRGRFTVDAATLAELTPGFTFLSSSTSSRRPEHVSMAETTWQGQPAVVIAVANEQLCAVAMVVDPTLSEPRTGRYVITPVEDCSADTAKDKVGVDPWW